jgi:hypothetical protein
MDLSDLGKKDTTVKKSFSAARMNTQYVDIEEMDSQKADRQDILSPKQETMDLYKQAPDNPGSELPESTPQRFSDKGKSETSALDMQSYPVHAFENKDKLNLSTYLSDVSETSSDKKIKMDYFPPDSDTVMRIASEGDTIFKLARTIYKIEVNSSILKKIRQSNPHISDLNHIEVGERIFFPKLILYDEESQGALSARQDVN